MASQLNIAVVGNGEVDETAGWNLLVDEVAKADEVKFVFPVTETHFSAAVLNALNFCLENEIPYIAISDGSEGDGIEEALANAEKVETVKIVEPKVVAILTRLPGDSEVIFAYDENDEGGMAVCAKALDVDLPVYDFTNALDQITAGDDDGVAVEPEPAAAPAEGGVTREQLQEILDKEGLDALKQIATDNGIEVPVRSRGATYIKAILDWQNGGDDAPAAADPDDAPVPSDATPSNPPALEEIDTMLERWVDKISESISTAIESGGKASAFNVAQLDKTVQELREQVGRLDFKVTALIDTVNGLPAVIVEALGQPAAGAAEKPATNGAAAPARRVIARR